MSEARERMLAAVRANKPPELPMPDAAIEAIRFEDPVLRFTELSETGRSSVVSLADEGAVPGELAARFPDIQRSWSVLDPQPPKENPQDYADLDLCLTRARFAVAENGAMWIDPTQYPAHAALVLCQHIAVLVSRTEILHTMHEAYARIGAETIPQFGLFLAGPSKTADIEQTLVIGAHGARSMTIFLV